MVKLPKWLRTTDDPAMPDRRRLTDGASFAPEEKSASVDAGEALLLLRTFEASDDGWFWATDQEGRLTYISECVAESLSTTWAALVGAQFSDVFTQADGDSTGRRGLPFVLARQASFSRLVLNATRSRDERYWAVSGTPQFGAAGQFTGYRGSAVDITEQRKSSEHASQLAKYDPLTGLGNRRRMAELLDGYVGGAEHHRRSCAVMLIDLDRFKQINDTLVNRRGILTPHRRPTLALTQFW